MFTKIHNLIPSSDFRKNLSKYFKEAKKHPLVISTSRAGDTSVVLSSELYNKLVESYEDMVDAKELTQLVKEDDGGHVSWSDVKKRHAI
jgi:hypothetical protein